MLYILLVVVIFPPLEEVMIYIFVMILIQKIPIIAIWDILTQEDYNMHTGLSKLILF
jgi:hypothetical protein